MPALLQHLLQHLHGYIADPVLLPAPSRGRVVQRGGMHLGGAGGISVPGFGQPMTPLGPPSRVSQTCQGMPEPGKVGSKAAQRVGGHRRPQGADRTVRSRCQCIPVTGQCQGLHVARNIPGLQGSLGPKYPTEIEMGGKILMGKIGCFDKGSGEGRRSLAGAPTQVGNGP